MFSESKQNYSYKEGSNYRYYFGDSRQLLRELPDISVDCIITSPPYLDLKDYGGEDQIGYRQKKDEYFSDMKMIFTELIRCAKDGAALWVVVDNVKKTEGLIMLPFELARIATEAGWKIHDFITWDKGKSLPWGHSGKLRGVTEQIVLMGKGQLKNFDIDKVRDSIDLSHYWIRYPERYSPYGKAPSNLWHFPIPVQGSWSKQDLRHACPLPEPLIKRMLLLTTTEGDTVLDPFAGTGSVLSAANKFERVSIGIDSSADYYNRFKIENEFIIADDQYDVDKFSKLIMDLRKQKISLELFKLLSRPDNLNGEIAEEVQKIIVENVDEEKIRVTFILKTNKNFEKIHLVANNLLFKPPLSKYGLSVDFGTEIEGEIASRGKKFPQFEYRSGKFFKFYKKLNKPDEIIKADSKYKSRYPVIISDIELDISTPADR
jgi:DNA modification methylase